MVIRKSAMTSLRSKKSSPSSLYDFDEDDDAINTVNTSKENKLSNGKRSAKSTAQKITKKQKLTTRIKSTCSDVEDIAFVTPKSGVLRVKLNRIQAPGQIKVENPQVQSVKKESRTLAKNSFSDSGIFSPPQTRLRFSSSLESPESAQCTERKGSSKSSKTKLTTSTPTGISVPTKKTSQVEKTRSQSSLVTSVSQTNTKGRKREIEFLKSDPEICRRKSRKNANLLLKKEPMNITSTPTENNKSRQGKRVQIKTHPIKYTSTPADKLVIDKKTRRKRQGGTTTEDSVLDMQSPLSEFSPVPKIESSSELSSHEPTSSYYTMSPQNELFGHSLESPPSDYLSLDEGKVNTKPVVVKRLTSPAKVKKKSKKTYSHTKYIENVLSKSEEVADKMNIEFEELDDYELSIEG